MRHVLTASAILALSALTSACSTRVSRFDVVQTKGTSYNVTRSEVADSGSGSVNAVGGHQMKRVTLGGYYLKRVDVAAPGGSQVAGGLHGNPRATR
jgi:hypothetical protein